MPSSELFEPIFMSDPDYDAIVKVVYASYPKACILMLDRIKNPELTARYEAAKEALGSGVTTIRVYHGTKQSNIGKIASTGFKAALNRTSAYGLGTYFAANFGYSRNYTDMDEDGISSMFICDILVKNKTTCAASTPIPPKYDTAVDNPSKPTIYVKRDDDQTLPVYLVRFHKTAA